MTECSGNVLLKEECENHEKCMKMIQAVLDGSASPEEIEHFKSNMEVCKPCFDGYELEKSIKNCLQTKVEKKNCPQNTVDQVKAKIGIGLVLLAGFIMKIKVIQVIFLS